jgi:peptidoglycan/xylan/chitin deacetylase (PgdA/CDA1 family)
LAVRTVDFQWQIPWIHDHGYRSMTLTEYLYRPPVKGDRVVILPFDDSYAVTYHQAFPIL